MAMKYISSITLGSDTTNMTLSSIPSTYTDLLLYVRVRNNSGATADSIGIYFNGNDTVGGDGYVTALTNNAPVSGSHLSFNNAIYWGELNANGSSSGAFTSVWVRIPSYTASRQKILLYEAGTANDYNRVVLGSGLWNNTSAISSLTITGVYGGSTTIKSGSSIYLYGITAGSGGATPSGS
jgi:hypothetical protein